MPKLTFVGLKCDNPECDWKDMSFDSSEYDKWLNKPCPKCGENLLTEADYKTVKRMENVVKVIDKVTNPFNLKKDEPRIDVPITMNGSGTIEFDLNEVNDEIR